MANIPEDKKKLLDIRLNEREKADPDALRLAGQANGAGANGTSAGEKPSRISLGDIPVKKAADVGSAVDPAEQTLEEILLQRKARAAAAANTSPAAGKAPLTETAEELTPVPLRAAVDANRKSPSEAGSGETDNADEAEGTADAPDTRSRGRRFLDRVLYILGGAIPHRGDSALEIVRKCVFMVALITLIASLSYIVNDMAIQPIYSNIVYDSLRGLYDPDNPAEPPSVDEFDPSLYPEGISDAFKALYAKNTDIRGWMTYTDTNGSWLNIDYPVMYSGDNSYYLTHNFNKNKQKDGALFFDERNHIDSPSSQNKALIVYGHNMASGHMFAKLNDFLKSLQKVRSAPLISLDTLYEQAEYKVFAVMLLNTRTEDGPYFDYLRTDFSSDKSFMDFVANIRARSLYTYGDVDVDPDDQLLILSTCTAPSGAKFEDGRCVVVARRVRKGESSSVNVNSIVKNENVIMPRAWYENQDLELHPFYTEEGYVIPGLWSDPETTTPPDASTTTTTRPTGTTTRPPIVVPTSPPTTPPTTPGTTTTSSSGSGSTTSSSGSGSTTSSATSSGSTTTTSSGSSTPSETTTTESTPNTEPTPAPTTEPTTPEEPAA